VGFCGIFKHFSGFEFSLLPNRIHARPHAGNASRWQAEPKSKCKTILIRKFRFIVELEKQFQFFSGGVFQVWFESGFQFAGFQVLVFSLNKFFFSAKFRFGFVKSLKLASRFLSYVSVNFGFDWLCRFLLAKFVVGFVGFQNRLVFCSKSSGKLSL
jgi:hypothetical protein